MKPKIILSGILIRFNRVTITSTHSLLQHVTSTQGQFFFSSRKPSLPQTNVTSTQICHFHANPCVSHKSVTFTRHFDTSFRQKKAPSYFEFFAVEVMCGRTDLCWSDVWKWRICVEVTYLCRSHGFVWKWRICVEVTDLCGSDGFVWKWGSLVLIIKKSSSDFNLLKLYFNNF